MTLGGLAYSTRLTRLTLNVPQLIRPRPLIGPNHARVALPLNANVLFMTLMAAKMPLVGRG